MEAVEQQRFAELAGRLAAGEVIRSPDVAGFGHDRSVRDRLGIVFDEFARARIVGHLETGPQHWQDAGIVHGGTWCSLVETLAAWGAALHASPPGSPVVAVSNNAQFVRPHGRGRVDAVATPVDLGDRAQLWEVVIARASDGKEVARGTIRFQQLEPAVPAGATAG
ncbi:PaaI family thioesterase [Nitriliruptor alkaliphilus]|uniref:PaaI family thioesterase n=1 Tax=Nitriliruptor alkaliphilus TaxID=427918 RepID=UPI000698846C|nr:PaaI family thioesterase [Nitriliruptor alkaliphilus]